MLTKSKKSNFKGASVIYYYEEDKANSLINDVYHKLCPDGKQELIVEVYYQNETVLYSEYQVNGAEGGSYLNHGIMRMNPKWDGFIMPGDISFNTKKI